MAGLPGNLNKQIIFWRKLKMKMKKLITGIVMAAFLTVAVAGQAMAYFEHVHLMRVLYDDDLTKEVATDLGDITAMDFTPGNSFVVGDGDDAFNLGMFPVGTAWADLQATYWTKTVGYGSGETYEAWIATTASDHVPPLRARGWTNFHSGTTQVMTHFGNQGGPTVEGDPAYQNSYNNKMNADLDGSYAYYQLEGTGEASLADLATVGYVDMYLYHFENKNVFVPGTVEDYMAVIRTYADGSTTMMSPVPIPGAAILFGSGLLALVGIRRRKSA